jgi:hypothetical protein
MLFAGLLSSQFKDEDKCAVLQGSLTVGYLSTLDQVVSLVSQGQFSQDQLALALTAATDQVPHHITANSLG